MTGVIPPRFVGVTGLPRAGSTLLCQMLAMHPEIDCEGLSSPLCNLLLAMRRMVSDDQFMLSQLDHGFDTAYGHLEGGMAGMLRGWYAGCDKPVVVDKNRAWLHCIEMVLKLAPETKMIVCLRELGQIYGSIEDRHQQTILLDFVDHFADYDRFGRADALFSKDKVIGAPLVSIHAIEDLPEAVRQRLFFLRYEDLMARPAEVMARIYAWLDVSKLQIDPERLEVMGVTESDSHYRMKFLHTQHARIAPPRAHAIPERIQARIESAYAWYYQRYYPKG